jgi:hypothetical protein
VIQAGHNPFCNSGQAGAVVMLAAVPDCCRGSAQSIPQLSIALLDYHSASHHSITTTACLHHRSHSLFDGLPALTLPTICCVHRQQLGLANYSTDNTAVRLIS